MTPVEITSVIGQVVTLLGSIAAIIIALISKKTRTPADDQARIEFGYRLLNERLTEANLDRQTMADTINYLRGELQKRDDDEASSFSEKQELRNLVAELQNRLREKDEIIRNYDLKLERLAQKVRNGLRIELSDIFDHIEESVDLSDIGNTPI